MRAARAADLPELAAQWLALAREHAARDPSFAPGPGAARALERQLAAQLRGRDCGVWVCAEEGALVGFAAAQLRVAPHWLEESARGEITELWVRPDVRRRGIGRALAGTATAWLARRTAPRVEVRVAAGNEAGRAFWRALGYRGVVDVLERRL